MSDQIRPGANAAAVTASDTTTYSGVRAVYVGGAGDVAIKFPGNATAVTFAGVAAGSLLPIQAEKVMATNTTATSIVVIY